MASSKSSGIFFAYAGQPALRAETMSAAVDAVNERGGEARTWQELEIDGQILINKICQGIDASSAVIAEISSNNSNVLFEAGFALGRNKNVWFAFDETDVTASKNWNDLALLSTTGRTEYSGNSERLVSKILDQRPDHQEARILDGLLAGARAKESNAVFAPSLPINFNAAAALEKMLDRQSHLTILGANDELGLAPLEFYVQQIYRSSAAVIHLLAPHRTRAKEHNARASLLAGIAHGMDIPLLLVVENVFVAPLDYRDLLFTYSNSASLQDHVKNWLATLPKPAGSNKRLGRIALDVELPIRTFGQYVAEYEVQELNDYFVETNEFQSILAGTAKLFVGRKGTGKTATMSQAVLELRKDRRNLVVSIKPSSYEMSGLVEILKDLKSDATAEYLLVNLWSYLIYTEVASRAIIHGREKPAGIGEDTPLRALELELEALGVELGSDLASRLEDVVADLKALQALPHDGDEKSFIADQLRVQRLAKLRTLLGAALHEFDRVAVLIDNLDKTWESGVDYDLMSRFILSLLTTSGRLEKEFARSPKGRPSINLTLTIFLRTDIFDVISKHAREPDKIGELSVQWHDAELLVRVLEERFSVNRLRKKTKVEPGQMWEEVFASEVRGIPTRDYLLWRALPRPRDFIYLANAAVTTAINRKHHVIQASDITFAETQYSRFAFDALLVESEAQGFDLEEVLYEFAGLDSTFDAHELANVLSSAPNPADVQTWLIKASFLGLETDEGEFIHIEGESAARRKLKVAERLAKRLKRPLRFRVHPAFRSYLDIRDDDLHAPEIRDITLQ